MKFSSSHYIPHRGKEDTKLLFGMLIIFYSVSLLLHRIGKVEAFSSPPSSGMTLMQTLNAGPLKVSVIGSGNWGSVIGKIVATNAQSSYIFDNHVRMWVFEEIMNGCNLTEIMNETHENVKYLPGVRLPHNLIATPTLSETLKDSNLLIFVLPHQFLKTTCEIIKARQLILPNAKAISLTKGLYLDSNDNPKLSSQIINEILGIECCALSGANVAKDIATEQFSEATIGYNNKETADIWQQLFDIPYFKINGVPDVAGVEICGALKNVIALAAGFSDGLNLGSNTKAAIIRQGFEELRLYSNLFFKGVMEDTFFDSAGIADTITTCFGGRNVKCAAEFIKSGQSLSWSEIEKKFLNGQKLQGTLTCEDVNKSIKKRNLESHFPLFDITNKIAFEFATPEMLINTFKSKRLRRIKLASDCTPSTLPSTLNHLKA